MSRRDRQPRVGISACLTGAAVRYDGGDKHDETLCRALAREVALIPVCPEAEIGLGVPRPPIYLQAAADGTVHLVEDGSVTELTAEMQAFAHRRGQELTELGLAGFVFKAKSPSCGLRNVPVTGRSETGAGLFAATLLETLPNLPAAEAEELTTPAARARFLERVFDHHRTLMGTAATP